VPPRRQTGTRQSYHSKSTIGDARARTPRAGRHPSMYPRAGIPLLVGRPEAERQTTGIGVRKLTHHQETERVDLELKRYIDPGAKRDLMLLVKQIVAMANTEGGRILVGVTDDGQRVGVPDRDRSKWDPAPLGDQLDRYINPDHVEVVIAFRPDGCPAGTVVVEVAVPQYPDPPLVICRDGSDQSRTIFRKGDVLVRNNTKVEPASRSDYARWRREDRQRLLESFKTVVLNPSATVQITDGTERLDPPSYLLSRSVDLFRQRPDKLLDGKDLLYLFANREYLDKRSSDRRRLLMHSALRRQATLWFWLGLMDVEPGEVADVLFEALDMGDRDKSDMSRAIVRVGCLFLTPARYRDLIQAMESSRYAHIRQAAEQFGEIADARASIDKQRRMSIEGRQVSDFSDHELFRHAELEIEGGRRGHISRRLPVLGLEYLLRKMSPTGS